MQVSSREKNILLLAGLVAVVFTISSVFPAVQAIYQQRGEDIESLMLALDRETRLIENTVSWRERRVEAEANRADLEAQIFSGATIPIVEANISRQVSRYARDSDITVSSTRLAERQQTDGWLLISQEVSFRTANASNTVGFLQKMETSMPRLRVTDFSLNRTRNQYSGSITVVGFARSQGLILDASESQ